MTKMKKNQVEYLEIKDVLIKLKNFMNIGFSNWWILLVDLKKLSRKPHRETRG